jgi:hypothetical protein
MGQKAKYSLEQMTSAVPPKPDIMESDRMTPKSLAGSPFPFRLRGTGGFTQRDISLAGPSNSVPNIGVTFVQPIPPAPVLSWFLSFLTPFGSDFTFVAKCVARLPCDIANGPMPALSRGAMIRR